MLDLHGTTLVQHPREHTRPRNRDHSSAPFCVRDSRHYGGEGRKGVAAHLEVVCIACFRFSILRTCFKGTRFQPARPIRVQNYRRACILRGSRTAAGPSRFETQGCAADGTADSPELWRAATFCIHVVVSNNAHRLCRVLLAFLFELPVWRCRRHRRV